MNFDVIFKQRSYSHKISQRPSNILAGLHTAQTHIFRFRILNVSGTHTSSKIQDLGKRHYSGEAGSQSALPSLSLLVLTYFSSYHLAPPYIVYLLPISTLNTHQTLSLHRRTQAVFLTAVVPMPDTQ